MAKNISQYNEEDLRRIEKERLEINASYDNGYSADSNETNKNGSSNSPDAANYTDRIDRYGFIHNTKLPHDLTDVELKRNNIEKLRETKWQQMLKDWHKHYSPSKHKYSDKLISRIYKGVPNSMRNSAWFKLLDIQSQLDAQKGVYEKMRDLARRYSLDLRQIDMDINRTFRNNEIFRQRYSAKQKQLYNILAAYSIYNTEIGYCQGMSTLTAFLLMYLYDEERTFWALSQLMSNGKYSMHGFFISGFPKLIRYSDKHEMIIKQFLPKIHKKLIKCNITPLIYTTKWFLQCYLDALPFTLVLRFWDVYLLKGDIAMLAMSYCILKMHKKTLLQKNFDMDKINDFLNHKIPENFYFDDDLVMEKLDKCIEKLQQFKMSNGEMLFDTVIPQNEMPKIPFGDFKKQDKQDMIAQLVLKSSAEQERDRDLVVSKLAQDRLDNEKRKREQRRQKRLQSVSNGGQIPNISDESDEDEENSEYGKDSDDDDDDDEDDLNPSKISEYDDENERYDKESMLSNLTHDSKNNKSSQLSLNNNNGSISRVKSNSSKNVSSLLIDAISKNAGASGNFMKSANNLNNNRLSNENSNGNATASASVSSTNLLIESSYNNRSPNKYQPNKAQMPTSHSYVTSIISNPPPQSPSFYTDSNKKDSIGDKKHIASIKSKFEYVRSPHGIYTRINVPPDANSFSYSRRSPTTGRLVSEHVFSHMQRQKSVSGSGSGMGISSHSSTSAILTANNASHTGIASPPTIARIAPAGSHGRIMQSSKRTSSLRSIQQRNYNQPSSLDFAHQKSHNNIQSNLTKQQLQNHSARIANIESSNSAGNSSNYSNIAIISQSPKSQINYLNQYINSMQLNSVNSSLSPQKQNQNNLSNSVSKDQIEQFDYI